MAQTQAPYSCQTPMGNTDQNVPLSNSTVRPSDSSMVNEQDRLRWNGGSIPCLLWPFHHALSKHRGHFYWSVLLWGHLLQFWIPRPSTLADPLGTSHLRTFAPDSLYSSGSSHCPKHPFKYSLLSESFPDAFSNCSSWAHQQPLSVRCPALTRSFHSHLPWVYFADFVQGSLLWPSFAYQ